MEVVGSIYTEVSERFQKGIISGGISRCVKAEKNDLGVIMADVNVIGSLEAKFESTNRIYDVGGCSPTLSTMQGGNQEPKILEEQIPCKLNKMPEGHLDSLDNAKICDIDTPTASTVTSRYYKGIGANRDNMCIVGQISSNGSKQYRIRKLTPRECGRLMGVSDEDIDKMAAVNSNTQLYKQFGNSIVVDVMCAMFKNLNIEQG